MKTQTISFVVLNPLPTLEPQVIINRTITLNVEEYVVFEEAVEFKTSEGRFIRSDEYYRVGITHNTDILFENIWLVFPTVADFIAYIVMKVAEINVLTTALTDLVENTPNSDQISDNTQKSDSIMENTVEDISL